MKIGIVVEVENHINSTVVQHLAALVREVRAAGATIDVELLVNGQPVPVDFAAQPTVYCETCGGQFSGSRCPACLGTGENLW